MLLVAVAVLVAAAPDPAPAPDRDDTITLVSFNVHQGFGNRRALDPDIYATILHRLHADIVVLQESDTPHLSSGGLDIVAFLADRLDMHAAYGRSGVAVLSRFPLAEVEPTAETRERQWFFEAGLDVGGETLWVHGVHLARSPTLRLAQAEEILDAARARPGPRILAGDLNSCPTPTCFGGRPSDDVYDIITTQYTDAWVAAGNARDDPAGATHSAQRPSRRIDYVFVDGVEVLTSGPVRTDATRLASDHLPVLARLRV